MAIYRGIRVYQGNPGGGKSLGAVEELLAALGRGEECWGNVALKPGWSYAVASRGIRRFVWTDDEIWRRAKALEALYHPVHSLDDLPQEELDFGAEGTRLAVFDEAAGLWNSRDYRERNGAWGEFWREHRKMGFNVIVCAQNWRMLDKQLRQCVQSVVSCYSWVEFRVPILGFPLGEWMRRWCGFVGRRECNLVTMETSIGVCVWRKNWVTMPRLVADVYRTMQRFKKGGAYDAVSGSAEERDDVPEMAAAMRGALVGGVDAEGFQPVEYALPQGADYGTRPAGAQRGEVERAVELVVKKVSGSPVSREGGGGAVAEGWWLESAGV